MHQPTGVGWTKVCPTTKVWLALAALAIGSFPAAAAAANCSAMDKLTVRGAEKQVPHDAQFVIRLPDNWNCKLVITKCPGLRRQYSNDYLISDWVLARGYAYASPLGVHLFWPLALEGRNCRVGCDKNSIRHAFL